MDDLSQATDNMHLILEDQFEGQADAERSPLHAGRLYNFWGNRYLCIQGIHDEEFWHFHIFDLLTNESKAVRFQKSSDQFREVETYFLNHKFMFVVEKVDRSGRLNCVNLVKFNWESVVFETVEHFERDSRRFYILVDPLNSLNFVLASATLYGPFRECQKCKLVNGKIEFGIVNSLSGIYHQYSSDKLIGIGYLSRRLRIKTYNMVDKQEKSFETKEYPDHVELVSLFPRKWVVDRVYAAFRFQDSGNYGLMRTDKKARQWTILDFPTTMVIRDLHFFNDTLIVRTKQAGTENEVFKSSVKYHGIDICRPQSLRQKAWLRVIRSLKAKGHPDPYKEAARYLPLNTDLRPHWFEDVEDEALEKQDEAVSDQGKDEKSNSDGTNDESEAIQGAKSDQGGNKDVEDEALKKQGNDGEE